jgi:hypothetical protein
MKYTSSQQFYIMMLELSLTQRLFKTYCSNKMFFDIVLIWKVLRSFLSGQISVTEQ